MDDLKKLKSLKANDNKPDPKVYVVDGKPLKSILKKPKQHGMNFEAGTTKEDAMNTKNKEVYPSRILIAPEVSVREFYITLSSNYDESAMVAAIEDVNAHQDQNFEKHGSPCNMGNKSYVDLFNDEDGLSLIATQISKPLMLDAYTISMCGEAWGHINFAHALIEVSSDSDLKKEVTMAVLNEVEMDYTREVISVEYEWQPPRCVDCKIFGHSSDRCPKIIREPITLVSIDTNSDGFKEVQRKKINDKKVDLQPRLRQRDGIRLNKANPNLYWQKRDENRTPSSKCNQEEEHEERIKELDEFDEDVDEFIFLDGDKFDIVLKGTVDWKRSKQSTTAMSAKEAEYIATLEAAMEAIWIRKFISGLGTVPTINEPIKMLCDNSAALLIANEQGVQKGTRHCHRRYHYVRELHRIG
ncbi:hypothetical protein Tco_1439488 [Tanacetum coccineum]